MTEQGLISSRPLPAARLGRSSRAAGGALAVAAVVVAHLAIGGWAPAAIAIALLGMRVWRRLPRVERFRVCARCGLTRDEDRARKIGGYLERSGSRYCSGWMGAPYNRCMSAVYRLG